MLKSILRNSIPISNEPNCPEIKDYKMKNNNLIKKERIWYWDTVKFLMILFVVVIEAILLI